MLAVPPTQVDALSSSQFRLEVVVVVAAPVVPAPLRWIANEQVGAVGPENESVLEEDKRSVCALTCHMCCHLSAGAETHQVLQLRRLGNSVAVDNDL